MILGSFLIIEYGVYLCCVIPSQHRVDYQSVCIDRFKQDKITWLKGEEPKERYYRKINSFYDRTKGITDNDIKYGEIRNNDPDAEYDNFKEDGGDMSTKMFEAKL